MIKWFATKDLKPSAPKILAWWNYGYALHGNSAVLCKDLVRVLSKSSIDIYMDSSQLSYDLEDAYWCVWNGPDEIMEDLRK